jgi:glycosyltransferase involved in cell wall biosynthesis
MNILSVVQSKDLNSGGPIYLCNAQKKFLSNRCYIKIISLENISLIRILMYFLGYKNKKLTNLLLKFSVVHFHQIWNFRHQILAIKLRKLSIPFMFSLHGHFDIWSVNRNYLAKKVFYFFFKKNFINASGVQISSVDELKEARIFTKNDNIKYFLISNGVELHQCHAILKKKEFNYSHIKILFFGRIHPKKGIELILKAFAELLSKNKNYTLTIVGPAERTYLEKINNLINNLKINSYVKILKPIFDELDKIKLLKDHDIFVLPSYEEADSVALKEALACGIAVIISKQCRLNEVVDYKCGLVIENNKFEDLLLAIQKISNKDFINIARDNATRLIHEKYTADLINENFYEIYYDVMNGTRLAKNWSCNNIL